MSVSTPRPGSVPGPYVAVRIWRAPEVGFATVRLLGDVETMHAHWPPSSGKRQKPAFACSGARECSPAVHRLRTVWQGYAPADYWCDHDRVWKPCVCQITPNWYQAMRAVKVRGSVWKVERVENDCATLEIMAALVRKDDPAKLRSDINVRATVARACGTTEIWWGAPLILNERQVLQAVDGDEPPTAAIPPQVDLQALQKEYLLSVEKAREEVKAAGGIMGMLKSQREKGNQQ